MQERSCLEWPDIADAVEKIKCPLLRLLRDAGLNNDNLVLSVIL